MPTTGRGGAPIHYEVHGHGKEAALLLHAFPLNAGMWAGQLGALTPRLRVVAPDYPGFGKSPSRTEPTTMGSLAEGVLTIVDGLHVERAVVVGMSMGGYLAFELYRRRPALFRALVLCDTRAGADTPEAAAGREAFAVKAVEKGLGWVATELLGKLLRPRPSPAAVDTVRRLISQGTPAGVAAAQRGMGRRPDSMPTLGQISCPTLVAVGLEDSLTPPAESRTIAATVRGARLVEFPDAGHLSNIESPEAFNRTLLEFVDGLPA
jgi:pimeloyl-ACP methyl ester carboxylesterase